MTPFNYAAPAELFGMTGSFGRHRPMAYRRFASGADAVRFAMEESPSAHGNGTVLESEENRFGPAEIRALYQSPAYPLARHDH